MTFRNLDETACQISVWRHFVIISMLTFYHQDEEQGLFPMMLGHSLLIDGMIERLMLDHDEIEKAWQLLAEQLQSPEKITDFDQFQREH